MKARSPNSGVIDYKQITGFQPGREVQEYVVTQITSVQQACVVPRFDGRLRDRAFWKLVMKVGYLQRRVPWVSVGRSRPRCSYAFGVAMRPLGVRLIKPDCRRNGS